MRRMWLVLWHALALVCVCMQARACYLQWQEPLPVPVKSVWWVDPGRVHQCGCRAWLPCVTATALSKSGEAIAGWGCAS
jgi:hypothetical protein